MNKIKDFKSNKNFNNGGPKFSLCLEADGLTCQIPNVYKTFCDGAVDPTTSPLTDLDFEFIKEYLVNDTTAFDPFDQIINEYGAITNSVFKTEFDPCYNVLMNNGNSVDGLTIIIKTIQFMKDVFSLTGYNEREFSTTRIFVFLNPTTLNINDFNDVYSLEPAIKDKLRICCMIYIVVNSKNILRFNSSKVLLNKSYYEIMLQYLNLINSILEILDTILRESDGNLHPTIRQILEPYKGNPVLCHLFFLIDYGPTGGGEMNFPDIFSMFIMNRYLGNEINNGGKDAASSAFNRPISIFTLPLKWMTSLRKETLATVLGHEIGHALKSNNINDVPVEVPTIIQKYREKINDIEPKWTSKYNGELTFDHMYNELFCDIIGIEWLEYYLFSTAEGIALSDDEKFNIIKNSFVWTCKYPYSSIDAAHPHHSLRVNLLLLSRRIHNFLCSYSNPKLVKFDKNSNPACLNDADYSTRSEYYSKYLKYKNKYLALKNKLN